MKDEELARKDEKIDFLRRFVKHGKTVDRDERMKQIEEEIAELKTKLEAPASKITELKANKTDKTTIIKAQKKRLLQ